LSYSTRLLTQDQINDSRNVIELTRNKAVGRNFIRSKFGRFINSTNMTYLSQRKGNSNDDSKKGDSAAMLNDFHESKEISFTTVSDVPMDLLSESSPSDEGTITVSTTKDANAEVKIQEIFELDFRKDIEHAAKKEQEENKLRKQDVLFIVITWVVIPAV